MKYKDYNHGVGILEYLTVTKKFIESQIEEFEEIDMNGNSSMAEGTDIYSEPEELGKFGKKQEEIESATKVLDLYANKIKL